MAVSPASLVYWHCHHNVLCEPVKNVEKRIIQIKAKPTSEVDTRLRLFKPVSQKASEVWSVYDKAVSKARSAYYKAEWEARSVYDKAVSEARPGYDKAVSEACSVYDKAVSEACSVYYKAASEAWSVLESLHKTECSNCPWDGRTIFP